MDHTQNAVAIFDKAAASYQEKYMDVSRYGESLDIFCNSLKPGASILELACGPGNITKYLLSKRPDLELLATDLAPNMVALAAANNPTAKCALMDCKDMNKLTQHFDGIVCGFCMPYLSKEAAIQLISDAAQQLNKGGALYLSTMEDDYSKSGWLRSSSGDELYMYFHEGSYLSAALVQNGFNITDMRRQDFEAADGTKYTDLIIVATK